MGLHDGHRGAPVADLPQRAVGGTLVFLVIMGGIFYGGWLWAAVAAAIALGSLWEFYGLLDSKQRVSRWFGMGAGAILLGAATLKLEASAYLSVIVFIAFLVLFSEVIKRQVTGNSAALLNMGGTLAGLVYVTLPWAFMILLRSRESGKLFLLAIFLCTWSCDVAAYFTGKRFGRTLLSSRVSPKKTWEGFAGGVVASVLCSGCLSLLFGFSLHALLLLGFLCGIAGQFGDLGESVLKREANVKDTSNLSPGHGGLLDRFDSILINATLAFFLFYS